MALNDQRAYYKYYGIKYNDWKSSFGKFSSNHYLLIPDYISDACDTDDYTTASAGTNTNIDVEFVYQHHIKKKYSVEGVVQGEFVLTCYGANSTVTQYRVSLWKTNNDTDYERLGVTYDDDTDSEWIVVNDTLTWDAGTSVGDEIAYHYYIDIWEHQDLDENDRIYLKIEVQCTATNTRLMHSNDPDWSDVWVEIPFIL